jgi:hypothetical protein
MLCDLQQQFIACTLLITKIVTEFLYLRQSLLPSLNYVLCKGIKDIKRLKRPCKMARMTICLQQSLYRPGVAQRVPGS